MPAITLPKSGGAISPLGEKFDVGASTGTASVSVPIPLPPGRSGFNPALMLTYDSGAGNGIFGMGWNVSLPTITRKTSKGLPTYGDDEESDVYLLSQAEDLVPAYVASGLNWVPDAHDDGSFHVMRYRPRVEGSFTRIERWRHKTTGDVHWRTTSPANVTSIFGRSPDARIADPTALTHVFTWLLEETHDGCGNVITYGYKRETLDNVSRTSASEKTRVVDGTGLSNRYIKRIDYGNRKPGLPDHPCFSVVFDYGEHDMALPTPEEMKPWASRLDPFSSYRASFEMRTYRLCRRVLVFHSFLSLGATPCLVRSTDFTYASNSTATYLQSITQTGYIRSETDNSYNIVDPNTGATLSPQAYPPVDFTYTQPIVDDTVRVLDTASESNLPAGIDDLHYRFTDLDSEGLSGILTEQADAWLYKRNLGGTFAAQELVAAKPSARALGAGPQLLDLAGEGQLCLVDYEAPLPGYYEHLPDGGWTGFTPFQSIPTTDLHDPNLVFVDLDGDSFPDILITEHDVLRWYPNLAKDGFAPAQEVQKPFDEDRGPAVIFADTTQSLHLADMAGDGLQDLVRIRNGEIVYWPNLGFGVFGAKIVMDGAPVFDFQDAFAQDRIRLADVDGSGTTDIVYLGRDSATLYLNQAGNSWSGGYGLRSFPALDNLEWVHVVDLFANGTACLVWSSPLPLASGRQIEYIDLMGGKKPHLLVSIRNNLGAETAIAYAPSTRFYVQDRLAGTPWVTKLPFPVQVVSHVEHFDRVTRSKVVSDYRFHHGSFDGVEREFRGFGMIEQWDTESLEKYSGTGLFTSTPETVGDEFFLPPMHTKTWYHTGVYSGRDVVSQHMATEYYTADPQGTLLPDSLLQGTLSVQEEREACRALKGAVLRQEIFADDGLPASKLPYTVCDFNYEVRRLQPVGPNRFAVFHSFEREKLEYVYERDPADPRVNHRFTLAMDEFGNTTKSASIAYPRRGTAVRPPQPEQLRTLATAVVHEFVNVTDQLAWYRIGLPSTSSGYELAGIPLTAPPLYRYDDVLAVVTTAPEFPYEETLTGLTPQKRLTDRMRTHYRKNDLSGVLSIGTVESLALVDESYRMVLTPGLVAGVYGPKISPAALNPLLAGEGRYQVDPDGTWWTASGRVFYSPVPASPDPSFAQAHFYLLQGLVDPFGNVSRVSYDTDSMMTVSTTDAVANTILASNDYRVLQPAIVTDANANRTAARYDALGHVVATALMGKSGAGEGDTLDDPTVRLAYDLFNWRDRGLPIYTHVLTRERHGSANPRWQESYHYSNGVGREILTKTQAEPGPAPERDASGKLVHSGGALVFAFTNTRWVGSGRTLLDNKGNTVKEYEPFFDSSPVFEDEADLAEWGVTPIHRYDPLGRLIRTDFPNGSLVRTEFTPWQTAIWDQNDTVLESAWHTARVGLPLTDPERAADDAASKHANTPGITHVDGLNRRFLTIADNATAQFETRYAHDIEGHQQSIIDALGRTVATFGYDMLGNVIHQTSIDNGERWSLFNAAVERICLWDSRDHAVRSTYDPLLRPLDTFVATGGGAEVLAQRTIYGDGRPGAVAANLCLRVAEQRDGAGIAVNGAYDFKGNLLQSTRQLLSNYRDAVDWSLALGLESEVFTTSSTYDALNRLVTSTSAEGSVVRPLYNEANLIEQLAVTQPPGAPTAYVTNVDYNAKGQRELIELGNGTRAAYRYDAQTFRLVELTTVRTSDGKHLQDLRYTYDPAGNVTRIEDNAQQTLFFNNAIITPHADFTYDAIYRLIEATGREHIGQGMQPQYDWNDAPRVGLPHPNDISAMRGYDESYTYDAVGNLLHLAHAAGAGTWQRAYDYAGPNPPNNRLRSTNLPADGPTAPFSAKYAYDAHGNTTSMPNQLTMVWDYGDHLHESDLQGGGHVYYVYDSSGTRVRKVWEKTGTLVDERIYLPGCEIFRRHSDGSVQVERKLLHVLDGAHRIALVERKTIDLPGAPPAPTSIRYQYENHLGSSSLECDEAGSIISYEEYYPFGNTSYQGGRSAAEASLKRYRFLARERDEETGLYYCGARYYAPWLGRWISCDPSGLVDGPNVYVYSRDNPIVLVDPGGTDSWFFNAVDSVFNPNPQTHPMAAAVMKNMSDRGGAMVDSFLADSKEDAEVNSKIVHGDVVGAISQHAGHVADKAIGMVKGAGQLVKSVGEAGGDLAYYGTHRDAPGADKKIGSAITDIVIDGPQLVLMVDGAAGAAKGLAGLAKAESAAARPGVRAADPGIHEPAPTAGKPPVPHEPPPPPPAPPAEAAPATPPSGPSTPAPSTPAAPNPHMAPNQRLIHPMELKRHPMTAPASGGRGVNAAMRADARALADRHGFTGPVDVAHGNPHAFTRPGQPNWWRAQASSVNRAEGGQIAKGARARRTLNETLPPDKHLPVRPKIGK
jgi:RHS repeat-associated protein